jgi:hypothetical protein
MNGQLVDLAEYRRTHGPLLRHLVAAQRCWLAWWQLSLVVSGFGRGRAKHPGQQV